MKRKKTDVIIFGGQSNMQGQTESLPESNDPVEGALEFRYYEDALIPLQNPVGEAMHGGIACMASSQGHGSLVPAFCRAYQARRCHSRRARRNGARRMVTRHAALVSFKKKNHRGPFESARALRRGERLLRVAAG